MLKYTYMQIIGEGFPGVECICTGNPDIYENIVHVSGDVLPSKQILDSWRMETYKNSMWELIKEERDRRKLEGGYKVELNGVEYWFHSDTTSRIQHMALTMLGSNMPSNIMWKTMSGEFILMTPALSMQIFQAAMQSDTLLFTVAEQKKAEMLVSTNPNEYSYLTGWPKSYGE